MNTTIEAITTRINATRPRSAWDNGVKAYALELLEKLDCDLPYITLSGSLAYTLTHRGDKILLDGADNWDMYSHGGSALCYDMDIAARLCAPWELRKTDNGRKDPNPRETWLDVQARALYQASLLIRAEACEVLKTEA